MQLTVPFVYPIHVPGADAPKKVWRIGTTTHEIRRLAKSDGPFDSARVDEIVHGEIRPDTIRIDRDGTPWKTQSPFLTDAAPGADLACDRLAIGTDETGMRAAARLFPGGTPVFGTRHPSTKAETPDCFFGAAAEGSDASVLFSWRDPYEEYARFRLGDMALVGTKMWDCSAEPVRVALSKCDRHYALTRSAETAVLFADRHFGWRRPHVGRGGDRVAFGVLPSEIHCASRLDHSLVEGALVVRLMLDLFARISPHVSPGSPTRSIRRRAVELAVRLDRFEDAPPTPSAISDFATEAADAILDPMDAAAELIRRDHRGDMFAELLRGHAEAAPAQFLDDASDDADFAGFRI